MQKETLYLDKFDIEFGGIRHCCEFSFSNPSLNGMFTKLMDERFGEIISDVWLFVQKENNKRPYIPLDGEKTFDLERGNITGLVRTLSDEQIESALDMTLTVAEEMDIDVVERIPTNMKDYVLYGQPLEYAYHPVRSVEKNINSPHQI